MSDSDKVKSQAMIDTSDSDTDVSDSEFRNVAKKPRLEDQGNVCIPQLSLPNSYLINYLQKSGSGSPRKSSSSSSSSSSGSGDEWEGNEKEAEKKK